MSELKDQQIQLLKLIQERKGISEIKTDTGLSQGMIYYILNGMAESPADNIPEKWRTDKQYLYKEDVSGLRNQFFLTPAGLKELYDAEIEIEVQVVKSLEECEICGFEDSDVLQTHHVIPKSYGGSDNECNLIVLCANCHAKVHAVINRGNHPVTALNKVAGQKILTIKEGMRQDE